MDQKSFRVLLDLSELPDKSYKYIWMNISTREIRTIRDLKETVLKKLTFDRYDIKLFVDDGLLLEDEKIMVLRENDTVKLQYEDESHSINLNSSSLELTRSRGSDVRSFEEFNDETDEVVKCSSKKSKRKSNASDTVEENGDGNSTTDEVVKSSSKKRKRKSTTQGSDTLEENGDHNSTKRKRKSDVPANETVDDSNCEVKSYKKKKSRSCISTPEENTDAENEEYAIFPIEIFTENAEDFSEKSMVVQNKVVSENSEENASEESVKQTSSKDKTSEERGTSPLEYESFVQGNNCKKRKRKQKKKRKSVPNLVSPFLPENNTSSISMNENTQAFNPCDSFASVRKHIRFASPTPNNNNNGKEMEVVDLDSYLSRYRSENAFEASPNKTYTSASKTSISPISNEANPKISTPAVQMCPKNNSWNVSPMHNESLAQQSVIHNKEAQAQSSASFLPTKHSGFNASSSKGPYQVIEGKKAQTRTHDTFSHALNALASRNTQKVIENEEVQSWTSASFSYTNYPDLNSLPPIGTHIAFKVLELDDNYSPTVSAYKEGIVKGLDPKTEDMEIVLTNVEVKPGRVGKFENLDEDELPPIEIIKKVTVNWSSLIGPRLIQRAQF